MKKVLIVLAVLIGGLVVLAFGTSATLFVVHRGDYSVPATTEDDRSLPHIELGGYRFHAETFGDPANPTIIVLHGGPGGDYQGVLPLARLADDYFVVFYDQRGSGLSPRVDDEELTVERYLADLDLFVDEFSPDRPVTLIGHSWGAMLATAYIGAHPSRVGKAVLAEPGFLDQEHMERYYERTGLDSFKPTPRIMAAMITAWAESLHVWGPDEHARKDYLIGRFFTTPMPDHPLGGYYRDGDIQNAVGEMWRFGAAASSAVPRSGLDENGELRDLAAGVSEWAGTALFIAGSEDTIIGPDHQRSQMRRFPRARLVVIEGAGHTMIGEQPDHTLVVIRDYLDDER